MSFILTKNTDSYKEAARATESIESPSLGFIKPSDYPSMIANTASIKKNNFQIKLLVQIAEDIRGIKEDIKTLLEAQKTRAGSSTTALPEELLTKLSNLTLGPIEKPKEPNGKILVFKDPLKILKEEKEKAKGK